MFCDTKFLGIKVIAASKNKDNDEIENCKIRWLSHVGTYSIWVQEMGADLRCKCTGIFSTGTKVGLHWQVKQL